MVVYRHEFLNAPIFFLHFTYLLTLMDVINVCV